MLWLELIRRCRHSRKAGTLLAMEADANELSESECFRVGRQFLDGASYEWLAERSGLSTDQAARAWEFCRDKLSQHLSTADGKDSRALSNDELRIQSERCLRLLLLWQENADRAALLPEEQHETIDDY